MLLDDGDRVEECRDGFVWMDASNPLLLINVAIAWGFVRSGSYETSPRFKSRATVAIQREKRREGEDMGHNNRLNKKMFVNQMSI